jgi:hypothetical protein
VTGLDLAMRLGFHVSRRATGNSFRTVMWVPRHGLRIRRKFKSDEADHHRADQEERHQEENHVGKYCFNRASKLRAPLSC